MDGTHTHQAGGASDASTPRTPRRIAVIGASGFDLSTGETTVRCFPWSTTGDVSAIADFDIAVVSFAEGVRDSEMHDVGLPKDITGPMVSSLIEVAGRLARAGGEVVVIGRPDTSFWSAELHHGWSSYPQWTGMKLSWDWHAGDRVERVAAASTFEPYLARVERYTYSLVGIAGADVWPEGGQLSVRINAWGRREGPIGQMQVDTKPLLETRHGGLVASAHTLSLPASAPGPRGRSPGRVVLLPPLAGDAATAVAVLLREVYGVPLASPTPPWLSTLVAPGEPDLSERAEALQRQLSDLQSALNEVERERAGHRRALRLLSLGDTALEAEVRSALRRLGAEVIEPAESNKEDGWIHVRVDGSTLRGVLEIKSTQRGTFDEGGLRQLTEWKRRALAEYGIAHKGIFIGNSAFGSSPDQRPNPFGHNFRATVVSNELVALSTTVLLSELRRVVDDGAPAIEFWRTLFMTNGVYE